MKYLLLLTISLLIFQTGVKAQSHLEPCESVFGLDDRQFDYYSAIRDKLFKVLPDSPIARLLTKPSFFPESVLDISKDDNGKYIATYVIAEKNIWYSEKRNEVNVKQYHGEIDPQLAELCKLLYENITSQVKVPDSKLLGTDGVNYYFFSRSGSGTIWSPNEGGLIDQVITITGELATKIQSNGKPDPDAGLQSRIKTLIEKLSPSYTPAKPGYFIPDAFPLDADAEVFRINTTNAEVKVYEGTMKFLACFPLKTETATCLFTSIPVPDLQKIEPAFLADEIKPHLTVDMLEDDGISYFGGDHYLKTNKGFSFGCSKHLATAIYGTPDKTNSYGKTERLEWVFEGGLSGAIPKPGGKPIAQNSYGQRVVMFFEDNRLCGMILYNNTK